MKWFADAVSQNGHKMRVMVEAPDEEAAKKEAARLMKVEAGAVTIERKKAGKGTVELRKKGA